MKLSLTDLFSIMIQIYFFHYGLITMLYRNCIKLETAHLISSGDCGSLTQMKFKTAEHLLILLDTSTNIHVPFSAPKRLST